MADADTADAEGGKLSPKAFAKKYARPKHSFKGCSSINDYELLEKLGEGTFGWVNTQAPCAEEASGKDEWLTDRVPTASMVYKARSLKHPDKLYALKKIIMHNEKDGVRALAQLEY